MFIAQHSSNPVLYSRQAISTREQEIGLTRKVGSTTANQAFTPHNLMRLACGGRSRTRSACSERRGSTCSTATRRGCGLTKKTHLRQEHYDGARPRTRRVRARGKVDAHSDYFAVWVEVVALGQGGGHYDRGLRGPHGRGYRGTPLARNRRPAALLHARQPHRAPRRARDQPD